MTMQALGLEGTRDTSGPRPYVFRWDTETGDVLSSLASLGGAASSLAGSSSSSSSSSSGETLDAITKGAGYAQAGASMLGKVSGGGTGARVSDALGSAAKGALMGVSMGAALGSVFPGVGTVIGGAVGAVAGAIGGVLSSVFTDRHRPLEQWEIAVLEHAKAVAKLPHTDPRWNPMEMIDGIFITTNQYRAMRDAGQLPSQKWAKNTRAALERGAKLNANNGDAIRKQLGTLTKGEAAMVSAAMTTGDGEAVLRAILAARGKKPPRQNLKFGSIMGKGMKPVQAPTDAVLPKPLFHIPITPMDERTLAEILRHVPAMQSLPTSTLEALAGLGSKARDVSGVDAVAQEYVMLPGQTLAGVADDLTGQPTRARELEAANPGWSGEVRIAIPPGMLSFVRGVTPAEVETSGNGDGDRQNITGRIWAVKAGQFPQKIATIVGAASRNKWFEELVTANPHKELEDDRSNFKRWFEGEIVNYPDAWPANVQATPAPGFGQTFPPFPGNATPIPGIPTVPAAGTMDPAVIVRAQGICGLFARKHPEAARPADFGTSIGDVTGTMTARFQQVLASFQVWTNARIGSGVGLLRMDGVLDPPTDSALMNYAQQEANGQIPGGVPGVSPGTPAAPGFNVPGFNVPGFGNVPGFSVPGAPGGMAPPGTPILTGPPATPIPIGQVFPSGVPMPGGTPILTGPPATPIAIGPVFPPGVPMPGGTPAKADGGFPLLAALGAGLAFLS